MEDGLEFLAQQQYPNGSWYSNWGTGLSTGPAVQAFQQAGYNAGDDVIIAGYNYGDVVGRAIDYLLTTGVLLHISPQMAGDPDTNGDGLGLVFRPSGMMSRDVQGTGTILPAIVGTETPNAIVTTGPLAGRTYSDIVQNTVDYFAYGQTDPNFGPYRGGWRYYANYSSADQSCTPWAVMALLAAEDWGTVEPAFVKSELEIFLGNIQNPSDGGVRYMPTFGGSNMYRTGAFLSEEFYVGHDDTDPSVQAALTYLNTYWQTTSTNGNYDNPGALWATSKGLEQIIGLDDTTTITNFKYSGPLDPGETWNWLEDYCQYLVDLQFANGSWAGQVYYDNIITTAWYVDVLAVATAPEPATLALLLIGGLALLRRRRA